MSFRNSANNYCRRPGANRAYAAANPYSKAKKSTWTIQTTTAAASSDSHTAPVISEQRHAKPEQSSSTGKSAPRQTRTDGDRDSSVAELDHRQETTHFYSRHFFKMILIRLPL
jgi:hypothetical protein